MGMREEIVRQGIALPLADRALVAAALGESLLPDAPAATGVDAGCGDALLTELQRRSAAYRAGTMTARGWSEVIAGPAAVEHG